MKHHASRFLKTVAAIYMAFPFSYLVLSALMFDVPANLCLRMLLLPSFYLLSMIAAVSGYGLWEMRRWAWYSLVTSNVLITYYNAVVLNDFAGSHHKILAFIASTALLMLLTYRVAQEVRVPYFFPKIRWWESNPRYRLSVPVKIQRKTGDPIPADILDLSMSGCFIKLRGELSQDEAVNLSFTVFGLPLDCSGLVVWKTRSTVTHPKGVGVKFIGLNRPQKRSLRFIQQRLKKISAFYRSSRYLLNQEEFLKGLEELESVRIEKKRARTG